MKKLLTIIMMAACLNGIARSQFTITPQAGINISKLQNPVDVPGLNIEVSEVIGYQLGGNIRIGGNLHLQPGFYYHKIGSDLKILSDLEGVPDFSGKINIDIIQIPLLIGYRFLRLGLFDLRIHGGGSLSFVTKAEDEIVGVLTKDDFNKNIWGLIGGAGFDVLFLSVDVDYEYGLTDMLRTEYLKTKNNVFRINAGIKL